MILNLVDNAVKADCRDVWISGTRGKDTYLIKIRDNGKGIPPKELGRITMTAILPKIKANARNMVRNVYLYVFFICASGRLWKAGISGWGRCFMIR